MTPPASVASFREQCDRTADWLASMPIERLAREEQQRGLITEVHRLAVRIIQLQCEIEPAAYPSRGVPQVPRLEVAATGSQLRVVGNELLATIDSVGARADTLDSEVGVIADELRALRKTGTEL